MEDDLKKNGKNKDDLKKTKNKNGRRPKNTNQ
jgi:hypothetical protein